MFVDLHIFLADSSCNMPDAWIEETWVFTQELKFDLVSPVDELAKQIRMEFDFEREAHVMDTISGHMKV